MNENTERDEREYIERVIERIVESVMAEHEKAGRTRRDTELTRLEDAEIVGYMKGLTMAKSKVGLYLAVMLKERGWEAQEGGRGG